MNKDEEVKTLYDEILSLDNIECGELDGKGKCKNVQYVDKMDITKDMMESSEVFNNVMKDWTREESPIQNTIQVKVVDINLIGKTAKEISDLDGVDVVKYGEGMVEQLVSVFKTVRKASMFIVFALILVTAFLIANTIKITIMSRKKEIEIMRLVGASNITIKLPFIIEGMILGLFGSIVPVILTTYGYLAFYKHFDGYLYSRLIELIIPEPFIYQTSLIVIGIGILVGMIGSASAVRKYLKI